MQDLIEMVGVVVAVLVAIVVVLWTIGTGIGLFARGFLWACGCEL